MTVQTAIVLLAHGSRDPLWRQPMDAVAEAMVRREPEQVVRCAFLESCEPALLPCVDQLVREGHRQVRIVPMFLGLGRHAREDLPALLAQLQRQHPGLDVALTASVGESARMIEALAQYALDP